MMDFLSDKIKSIHESQTLAMAQRSREMKAKGFDIINLSLGEPDFNTPEYIKDAAKKAIDENFTFYTPVPGCIELREAVCSKLLRDNGLNYHPDQIIASTGAKQSIINILMSILDDGDEVLIPAPYWVSYIEMVKICGAKPVIVSSSIENNFKLSVEDLKKAITPKTKAILYSSPCNPTGAIFSEKEIREIAEILKPNPKIVVISDEIYEYINFNSTHFSMAQVDFMKDRTVIINGLSKGFAMTGWRLGFAAAPIEISKAALKLQGLFTSATCSITQKAAVAALTGPLDYAMVMRDAYKRRADLALSLINDIPGMIPNEPEGAFYIFPDISYYFGKKFGSDTIKNAEDLALFLLEHALVAVVSGDAFGNENCIRLSFATSENQISSALNRIKNALALLK